MTQQIFTNEQLETILNDATPGPWRVEDETTLIWGHCNDDDNSTRGMGYPIAQAQLRNYGWNADAINWERVTANAALIAAAPDLARLVLAKDAEIARLKAQIQDIKECWDWWQEDTYDRCSSVVDDAIRQAMKEETSDDGN